MTKNEILPMCQRVQFWFQTNQLTTTVSSGRLVLPKHRLMTLAQREQNFRLWPLSGPNNEHHPRGRKSLHLGHFVDPSAEWLAILIWIDSILKIMVRVLSQLMVVQEFGDMRHIRYDWLINIFNHRNWSKKVGIYCDRCESPPLPWETDVMTIMGW